MVTIFLEVDQPETWALLTAIAALVDDDALRKRIDRELASPSLIMAGAHYCA